MRRRRKTKPRSVLTAIPGHDASKGLDLRRLAKAAWLETPYDPTTAPGNEATVESGRSSRAVCPVCPVCRPRSAPRTAPKAPPKTSADAPLTCSMSVQTHPKGYIHPSQATLHSSTQRCNTVDAGFLHIALIDNDCSRPVGCGL